MMPGFNYISIRMYQDNSRFLKIKKFADLY